MFSSSNLNAIKIYMLFSPLKYLKIQEFIFFITGNIQLLHWTIYETARRKSSVFNVYLAEQNSVFPIPGIKIFGVFY